MWSLLGELSKHVLWVHSYTTFTRFYEFLTPFPFNWQVYYISLRSIVDIWLTPDPPLSLACQRSFWEPTDFENFWKVGKLENFPEISGELITLISHLSIWEQSNIDLRIESICQLYLIRSNFWSYLIISITTILALIHIVKNYILYLLE